MIKHKKPSRKKPRSASGRALSALEANMTKEELAAEVRKAIAALNAARGKCHQCGVGEARVCSTCAEVTALGGEAIRSFID